MFIAEGPETLTLLLRSDVEARRKQKLAESTVLLAARRILIAIKI